MAPQTGVTVLNDLASTCRNQVTNWGSKLVQGRLGCSYNIYIGECHWIRKSECSNKSSRYHEHFSGVFLHCKHHIFIGIF